jgi:hypothetical protein
VLQNNYLSALLLHRNFVIIQSSERKCQYGDQGDRGSTDLELTVVVERFRVSLGQVTFFLPFIPFLPGGCVRVFNLFACLLLLFLSSSFSLLLVSFFPGFLLPPLVLVLGLFLFLFVVGELLHVFIELISRFADDFLVRQFFSHEFVSFKL